MFRHSQYWGNQAAGVLVCAEDTGRFLVSMRSPYVMEPNTWGIISGKIDEDEDPETAVKRELHEETGYNGPVDLIPAYVYQDEEAGAVDEFGETEEVGFTFYNFVGKVPTEFDPSTDWETEYFEWMTLDELQNASPKHFGLDALLSNSSDIIKEVSNNKMEKEAQFKADPPETRSYLGIETYPGFHTTKDFSVAAIYALGRIVKEATEQDENGNYYVDDYPVVVALDMSNHEKLTDYDAVEMVEPQLQVWLDQVVEDLPENPTDNDILNAAQNVTDTADITSDLDQLSDPIDYLAEDAFYHFKNPLSGISGRQDFPDIVRNYIETGQIPEDVLMEATDQYRYLSDVGLDRIVRIYYITPVSTEMINWDDKGEEEEKWLGFDVLGDDDVYGGYWNPQEQVIYEAPEQLSLFGEERDIEYHGTTYNRFAKVDPELVAELPEPPSPPFRKG